MDGGKGGVRWVAGDRAGKRCGFQAFGWVASYVLSAQRHAVEQHSGRPDQGATVLPSWKKIYEADLADAVTDSGRSAPEDAEVPAAISYGVTSRTFANARFLWAGFAARAQLGHPPARFRVP